MKFLEWKNNFWLFVGVLLACFSVSAGVRYQQFETWKENPNAFFVGERPMMTTLDAPYWLRWAREYNEGIYLKKSGLRAYPDSTDEMSVKVSSIPLSYVDPTPNFSNSSQTKGINYRDIPLLSYLISNIVPFFDNNYYLTGTLLIPIFASLFIVPLGVYFFRIGVPVSGLLGGLIGTFAGGYYMRSSIGRIDTDMLNLFFPILAGLLILFAGKAIKVRNVLLYSIGAGLSLFFFHWWYNKAGFILAYFIVLVLSLFVQQIRFRTILVSAFLFVLCANPLTFMGGTSAVQGFLEGYFSVEDFQEALIDKGKAQASFPNTMTTISEVNRVPMEEVLRRVLSNTTLDWIGVMGFLVFAVFRWRVLLPLLPMLALGVFSFQSSNRFIMFLAPFIGIGLGWLLQFGIDGAFYMLTQRLKVSKKFSGSGEKSNQGGTIGKGKKFHAKGPLWLKSNVTKNTQKHSKTIPEEDTEIASIYYLNWVRQCIIYGAMGLFFWLISSQTAISFVPGPSINTAVYMTFLEVKKRVPKNSALLTWWDYGYAITDATGLATFHDGGSQFSPKTYFIARGLISSDPDELYDIVQYLSTEGNRGINKNNTSPESLLEAIRNPQNKPWDPIFLFFTLDLTGKYGAISKLGSWDIVNGGSKPRVYQNLSCNKITNEEINCRGVKIDFKAGKINNQVPLHRLIFIRNGQVIREQKFGHNRGFTLQVIVVGKNIVEVQLIDEDVFLSNYNQMFMLGRYRKDLFEEAYNAFPFSRLYKINY